MRKVTVLLVLLAALAMFTTPASAGVSIYLSTSSFSNALSSAPVASSSGDAAQYGGLTGTTFGSFNVKLLAVLKTQGASTSTVQSSTISIKNNTNQAQSLFIVLGGTAYTSPVTPPHLVLSSQVGGSSATNVGSLTFQSYVTQGNTVTNSGFSPGLQSYTGLQTFGGPGTAISTGITLLTAPYAMNEAIQINLAGKQTVNFGGTTTLATPEPATMTLWGIGLAVCGLGARRRRNAKVA